MGRIFKSIVAGFLILSIATWGTPAWAVIEVRVAVPIPISVSIGENGTYTLSAAVVGGLTFDLSTVTTSDPWRVSSGYIDIDLSSPTNTSWGLRIVSDNVADLLPGVDRDAAGVLNEGGVPITPAADGSYTNAASDVFAGFDLDVVAGPPYSYSGLINTSDMDNPSMRAGLAWQVSGYDTSGAATAALPVPANPVADGARGASSAVGGFDDPWAYISDRSNGNYRNGVVTIDVNTPAGGRVVYRDDTNADGVVNASDAFVTNYTLVAYGTPYGANLASHPGQYDADPEVDNRPLNRPEGRDAADPWDIYVYLCAQFMNTDYTIAGGTDFVLPTGDYTTSIYLEVFSE